MVEYRVTAGLMRTDCGWHFLAGARRKEVVIASKSGPGQQTQKRGRHIAHRASAPGAFRTAGAPRALAPLTRGMTRLSRLPRFGLHAGEEQQVFDGPVSHWPPRPHAHCPRPAHDGEGKGGGAGCELAGSATQRCAQTACCATWQKCATRSVPRGGRVRRGRRRETGSHASGLLGARWQAGGHVSGLRVARGEASEREAAWPPRDGAAFQAIAAAIEGTLEARALARYITRPKHTPSVAMLPIANPLWFWFFTAPHVLHWPLRCRPSPSAAGARSPANVSLRLETIAPPLHCQRTPGIRMALSTTARPV